jgi:polar amino acid transport system permease protein
VDRIEVFFRWLHETQRMNFTIGYDAYDRGRFFVGLLTTAELSIICIVLSLLVGVTGAWVQGSRSALLRNVTHGYIAFFRNTPPLIQLYFFYFALGSILPQIDAGGGLTRPPISGFGWAVISLSFFAGALNVEIFRAGLEAVPRTTVEAAEALGYTRWQSYRHVVLPLALRVSLPALGTNLVNLVKTTTLAYAIAVPELLYVSAQIWSDELNVREMMNLVLLSYVAIIAVLVWILHHWERALRIPGFGRP